MKPNKKRSICGICSAGCWVKVAYDPQGKIDTVEPDEGSPLGKICRLGEMAREIVYSPNRLLHPLRRKGSKGTFEFERISCGPGPEGFGVYAGIRPGRRRDGSGTHGYNGVQKMGKRAAAP